jgi:hypothetical protein
LAWLVQQYDQDSEGLFMKADSDAVLAQLGRLNVELERSEEEDARQRITSSDSTTTA